MEATTLAPSRSRGISYQVRVLLTVAPFAAWMLHTSVVFPLSSGNERGFEGLLLAETWTGALFGVVFVGTMLGMVITMYAGARSSKLRVQGPFLILRAGKRRQKFEISRLPKIDMEYFRGECRLLRMRMPGELPTIIEPSPEDAEEVEAFVSACREAGVRLHRKDLRLNPNGLTMGIALPLVSGILTLIIVAWMFPGGILVDMF